MNRGFTLFEMVVVVAVVAILAAVVVGAGARDRLDSAARANLGEQGRLFLDAARRLNAAGFRGAAETDADGVRGSAGNPLPAGAVEHLARADRGLAAEHRGYQIASTSAGAVVTLRIGAAAAGLAAVPPPDASTRSLDDGGFEWEWRAAPPLGSRAKQVMKRLY